jgi:plasmid stabilization system protein ParE
MAKKIIWTKRADGSFSKILDYLIQEWGQKVTEAFIQRTYNFLDILTELPEMGAIQNAGRNIRGFTLTKHITVFYRIENQNILLLNFFDNRQRRDKK